MKKTLLHKGFTLIELLVVIAIIALLTAIVTSNFAASKAKSRDAKRVSDIAQIQLALSLYFDRCNDYPPALDIASKSVNCSGDPGELNLPLSTYISVIPKDPINTGQSIYTYRANPAAPASATDYVIRARLEGSSSVLADDIDTTTFTLACDDTSSNYYYCVKPN